MKNFVQIAIVAFILIFAASCGNNEMVVEKSPTYCHVELVSTSLKNSVVADEMMVRTGQSISGLVKDHKKKVVGYTSEMFLADNPEITNRTPYTKLDPCDSNKVKYTTLPIYAGDIVYLRHPYRIDTVPGNEASVVWKTGPGRLRQIIDMDDEGRFVVTDNSFICDNRTIVPPTDKEEIILPPHSGNDSGSSSGLSDWLPWTIIGLLLLAGFIVLYRRIGNQHDHTRDHSREQHDHSRRVVHEEHQQTRNSNVESMKNLGSELSQAIADEGKADREMLTQQLDAERKSHDKTIAAFMKAVGENGGLSGKKKE